MKPKIFFMVFVILLFFAFIGIVVASSYFKTAEIQGNRILFLPGSNIYIRIFLFFFPISNEYQASFNFQDDSFNLELHIEEDKIKKEPSTPSYIESDLTFFIKNIPYDISGKIRIPVTLRCNKKFIQKKVDFSIYHKEDIIVMRGALINLYIKELTENEYFKNRKKWKVPFYFDLRLQNTNIESPQSDIEE